MMKKLLVASLLIVLPNLAHAVCVVTTIDDDNSIGSLRHKIETTYNKLEGVEPNCLPADADINLTTPSLKQSVIFDEHVMGSTPPLLDLNKPLHFRNKTKNIVIGYYAPQAVNDSQSNVIYNDEYKQKADVWAQNPGNANLKKLLTIYANDPSWSEGELPFVCDAQTQNAYFRNILVLTNKVSKSKLLADSTCIKDAGYFWVCGGIYDATKELGAAGWCDESAIDEDKDGDGYCVDINGNGRCDGLPGAQPGDCNDDDASVNPGAAEICGNGKDDDCDGLTDAQDSDCPGDNPDQDGDGYCVAGAINCPDGKKPNDCDDNNPNRHPDALEIPGNGIDEDCDGSDGSCTLTALPESISIQQGADYDFSVKYMTSGGYKGGSRVFVSGLHTTMTAPEMTVYSTSETHPINISTSVETPVATYTITFSTKKISGVSIIGNSHSSNIAGINGFQIPTELSPSLSAHNNLTSLNGTSQAGRVTAVAGQSVCSATVRLTVTKADGEDDNDDDGYCEDTNLNGECDNNPDKEPGDCDDNNAAVHPGADEICSDNIDNNCNDQIDEGCGGDEDDKDGDGYCEDLNANGKCDNNPDKSPGDCNDNDRNVHPGAEELCTDAIDNNCDGNINEGCLDGEVDNDNDGYCRDTNANGRCDYAPGAAPGDCNDNNFNINPGMAEICDDNIDNNCDGAIDDLLCINPQEPGTIPGGGMRLLGGSCSLDPAAQATSSAFLLFFLLIPLFLRASKRS